MNNIKDISKHDALLLIEERVYEASLLFEDLEDVGRIDHNGHHVAQKIGHYAKDLLEEIWID